MKLLLKSGVTSRRVRILVQDARSTTGAGLTGLAFNAAGLKWSYIREDQATATTVTPATATLGAWTAGGFMEIDAANLPGFYELGIPDAALASGASVQMLLFGAANMAPCPVEIELIAVDHQDATAFGLSRLDAAVSSRSTYTGTDTGGTTTLLGRLTAGRATNLDNIDAAITSRSTYAGADTSGTTTLLSRIPGTIQPQTGDSYARLGAAGAGLTALGDARLAHLDADVSSRSTYAGGDTSGTATLLGRLTSGRATGLDNLDAAITSRSTLSAAGVWDLATAGHTTSGTFGAAMNAAGSAGDPWATSLPGSYGAGSAGYILGHNIDATVSGLPAAVWAAGTRTLSAFGFSVTVGTNNDKAGYTLAAAGLDAITVESGVNARQALSPILAACAGVLSGAGTGTIVVKGGNVTTTRITATTDSAGNRTASTLNLPT